MPEKQGNEPAARETNSPEFLANLDKAEYDAVVARAVAAQLRAAFGVTVENTNTAAQSDPQPDN